MSFGGSVSSMIASLKNNKRKRKSAFEKLEKYQKESSDALHFENTATSEDLEKIRTDILKYKKRKFIINATLFVVVAVLLYYVLAYINLGDFIFDR